MDFRDPHASSTDGLVAENGDERRMAVSVRLSTDHRLSTSLILEKGVKDPGYPAFRGAPGLVRQIGEEKWWAVKGSNLRPSD